jgi:hypothetical protein
VSSPVDALWRLEGADRVERFLKRIVGLSERLFYIASIAWFVIVSIELGHIGRWLRGPRLGPATARRPEVPPF